jgi:hypothetical protein
MSRVVMTGRAGRPSVMDDVFGDGDPDERN